MTVIVWIIQSVLGLLFIITGSFKFFQSREKVIESGGTWAEDFRPGVVKLIAGLELVSGLALILQKILGHYLQLALLAAFLIALIMLGAIVVHFKRKEFKHAGINVIFLLMALFVLWAVWWEINFEYYTRILTLR